MLLDVSENLQLNPLAFGTISEYIEVKTQIFSNTKDNLNRKNGHLKTTTHRKLYYAYSRYKNIFILRV